MNPLLRLSPAVYAALAGLAVGGVGVPVYEHLAGNTPGHYVLLQQPTAVTLSTRPACRQWTCTVLVDVITQFADVASSGPADALADQILTALDGQRLALPDRWDCGPGRCELHSEGPADETDGALRLVRRLLRLRWDVTYSPLPVLAPGLSA